MANVGVESGSAGANAASFRIGDALQRNPENISSQPVSMITGANRDIGGAITFELATKLNFAVIGIHRDADKETKGSTAARAAEIRSEVLARGGEWLIGDITTSEGRQGLVDAVDRLGGKLDLLMLNAAGQTRELNVVANGALIDDFLPKMNEGGMIVYMQSVPGHFMDILDPTLLFEGYATVAPTKNEAEKTFRSRIPEFEDRKIKYVVLCPPEVPDTSNMKLFNSMTRRLQRRNQQAQSDQASERSAELSRNLGLPEAIDTNGVALKIIELWEKREELSNGYTEFFNGTKDARGVLSQVYGEKAIYVDTVEQGGNAHALVSDARIGEARLEFVKEGEGDLDKAAGSVEISDEDCRDHFGYLPGHKTIRIATEPLKRVFERINPGRTLQLKSIDKVTFGWPVRPHGGVYNVEANIEKTGNDEDGTAIYNAIVVSRRRAVGSLEGLRFIDVPVNEDAMQPDQLIEASLQGLGVASGILENGDELPQFEGFENAKFGRMPSRGEAITISGSTDVGGGKFLAATTARVDDEIIATISKATASMRDRRKILGISAGQAGSEERGNN